MRHDVIDPRREEQRRPPSALPVNAYRAEVRWYVECPCGWFAYHVTRQDAIDDGDEHVRIMGHDES